MQSVQHAAVLHRWELVGGCVQALCSLAIGCLATKDEGEARCIEQVFHIRQMALQNCMSAAVRSGLFSFVLYVCFTCALCRGGGLQVSIHAE